MLKLMTVSQKSNQLNSHTTRILFNVLIFFDIFRPVSTPCILDSRANSTRIRMCQVISFSLLLPSSSFSSLCNIWGFMICSSVSVTTKECQRKPKGTFRRIRIAPEFSCFLLVFFYVFRG